MNKKAPLSRVIQHASAVILLLLSVFSLPAHQFIEHSDSLTTQSAHKHHHCGHIHEKPERENTNDHEDCELCKVLSLQNCQVSTVPTANTHTRLIKFYCGSIRLQQASQHYTIEGSSRAPPKFS